MALSALLAEAINPARTAEIVNAVIPKVLWEYGVSDPQDPTWLLTDISWSTDPGVWEAARAELATIIESSTAFSTRVYLPVVIRAWLPSQVESLAQSDRRY